MDLKLFNSGSTVDFGVNNLVLNKLESDYITSPTTSRLEDIANKVVKFLLTEYGSNAFDTTYGSNWIKLVQISQDYIPQYIMTISSDIESCVSYIKNNELSLSTSIEKLYTVKFNGLEFSTAELSSNTEILISITIYTTFGNKASFTLTK